MKIYVLEAWDKGITEQSPRWKWSDVSASFLSLSVLAVGICTAGQLFIGKCYKAV